jgi:hypothetical protein
MLGIVNLDMIQGCLIPQLEENIINRIYQEDVAPIHFHNEVMSYLHELLPNKLIGLGGLRECPPRSPDFTDIDLFSGGLLSALSTSLRCRVHHNT